MTASKIVYALSVFVSLLYIPCASAQGNADQFTQRCKDFFANARFSENIISNNEAYSAFLDYYMRQSQETKDSWAKLGLKIPVDTPFNADLGGGQSREKLDRETRLSEKNEINYNRYERVVSYFPRELAAAASECLRPNNPDYPTAGLVCRAQPRSQVGNSVHVQFRQFGTALSNVRIYTNPTTRFAFRGLDREGTVNIGNTNIGNYEIFINNLQNTSSVAVVMEGDLQLAAGGSLQQSASCLITEHINQNIDRNCVKRIGSSCNKCLWRNISIEFSSDQNNGASRPSIANYVCRGMRPGVLTTATFRGRASVEFRGGAPHVYTDVRLYPAGNGRHQVAQNFPRGNGSTNINLIAVDTLSSSGEPSALLSIVDCRHEPGGARWLPAKCQINGDLTLEAR